MFIYRTAEQRIAADHPLRVMRRMVDQALKGLRDRLRGCTQKAGTVDRAGEVAAGGTARSA